MGVSFMTKKLECSFCAKDREEVKKLVAGPGVYICDECIELCMEIVEDELAKEKSVEKVKTEPLKKPREISELLDDYVIGQDKAKKSLAVAVYNHYKRVNAMGADDELELGKSNICMMGPTGSGKTLFAQTIARILDVPFAIADATTLTEAGYVGEDVENILRKLIESADYDVEKAEKGIIYIDEIDKITRKSENPSVTRDVSGEGVQQALLKILEGTVASVPPQGGRKHPHQDMIQIDTTNILFICGGSFAGIESIIKQRLNQKAIGFDAKNEGKVDIDDGKILNLATVEDIMKFGLIPELVGRMPVIAPLEQLDEAALIQVLTEPKNALIKQYEKLFSLDNIEVEFSKDALKAIAHEAITRKTGARGLRSILEENLLDLQFDLPSDDNTEYICITEDFVKTKEKQTLLFKKDEEKTA